jgi:hypothetical protein
MQNTPVFKERLSFLESSLQGFNKCSKIVKDRICKSFRLLTFPAGHPIFKEGDFIKNGYLIRKGEVELFSRRNLRLINYIAKLQEEKKLDQDQILKKLLSNEGELGLRGISEGNISPMIRSNASIYDVT